MHKQCPQKNAKGLIGFTLKNFIITGYCRSGKECGIYKRLLHRLVIDNRTKTQVRLAIV
jgi:hypothetical protein